MRGQWKKKVSEQQKIKKQIKIDSNVAVKTEIENQEEKKEMCNGNGK